MSKGMGRTVTPWWGGGSYGNDNRTHRRLERRVRDREAEAEVATEICWHCLHGSRLYPDMRHVTRRPPGIARVMHEYPRCRFLEVPVPEWQRWWYLFTDEGDQVEEGRRFFSTSDSRLVWTSERFTLESVEQFLESK